MKGNGKKCQDLPYMKKSSYDNGSSHQQVKTILVSAEMFLVTTKAQSGMAVSAGGTWVKFKVFKFCFH